MPYDPTGFVSHPDELHRGHAWKRPVRCATTANITLSGEQTIDAVAAVTGDRVLVKNQTAGAGNGLWICQTGAWVRAFDMDQDQTTAVIAEEVLGTVILVLEGTVNGGTLWRNTNTATPILGTTALTFAQIASGVTDHGALSGLADDDHPQYASDADLAAHTGDATDAHDASSISVLDTGGNFAGTDVEAVLAELDAAIVAGGIPATIVDVKGDLIAATAADTVGRLAAAANGASLVTASGEATGLKWRLNNDAASAAPTVNDDTGDGYTIGSRWLDTTNDKEYVCLDASSGAAVWVETTGAGGGSDLVQTVSGGGSVYIPGLRGSPDRLPSSPSSFNDEFESLSGWTTLGTLDTNNVSDVPSHLHIKRTLVAVGVDGLYKTAPSMPFTVTIKFGGKLTTNYDMAGILLTEASPGKLCTFGLVSNTGTYYLSLYRWTNRASFASNVDVGTGVPTLGMLPFPYVRLIVASSTDVTCQVSHDGMYWFGSASHANATTNLTVANVGVCIGDAAAAGTTEMYVDWIRFT